MCGQPFIERRGTRDSGVDCVFQTAIEGLLRGFHFVGDADRPAPVHAIADRLLDGLQLRGSCIRPESLLDCFL